METAVGSAVGSIRFCSSKVSCSSATGCFSSTKSANILAASSKYPSGGLLSYCEHAQFDNETIKSKNKIREGIFPAQK